MQKENDIDALINWDGQDPDIFFDILSAVLENDTVTVIRTGMRQPVIIETLEEMEHLLLPKIDDRIPSASMIPEGLKNRIISEVVPSVPMQEYLAEKKIYPAFAAELVFKSPVPLQKKAGLIRELAAHEDLWRDILEFFQERKNPSKFNREHFKWLLADSLHELKGLLDEAIANLELKKGEAFYLTDAWYDEDYQDEHDTGITGVTSYEAAVEAIHREYAYEEWDPATADVWTVLDKFVPCEDGIMSRNWRYFMIYDQPVYFEKKGSMWEDPRERRDEYSAHYGKGNGGDLECLVPFPVGTILSVGSFPFSPVKPGVLIENFEEFVEVLCRGEDGEWQIANLAHRMEWGLYQPLLSCLYRVEAYKEPLEEDDKILQEVSNWISGDEEKGHRFWNAVEPGSGPQEDEDPKLLNMISRLHMKQSK